MPIPQSGWGLTPGTLEKNVTRSLGGKYGAIGKDPGTISDMLRTKYASGLQAKSVKEASDLAKNIEANRKAESTRAFGLDTEKFGFSKALEDTRKSESTRAFGLETDKFGFTQSEAEKKWEDALRGYEQEERRMTGGWSQQDLDRALREEQFGEQLGAEQGWRASELSQRAREAASLASSRNATLAEQQAARKAADDLRRYLEGQSAERWSSELEYGKTQDEESQRRWEGEQARQQASQDRTWDQQQRAAEEEQRRYRATQAQNRQGMQSPQTSGTASPAMVRKTSPGGTVYYAPARTGTLASTGTGGGREDVGNLGYQRYQKVTGMVDQLKAQLAQMKQNSTSNPALRRELERRIRDGESEMTTLASQFSY